MDASILQDILFFTKSLLFGIFLGILYDVVRILRMMFGVEYRQIKMQEKPKVVLPYIQSFFDKIKHAPKEKSVKIFLCASDILYFLLAGGCYAVFLFAENEGIFRLFSLFALFFGFLAYYFTLGKVVMQLSKVILFAFQVAVAYLVFFFFLPIRYLYRGVVFIGRKTVLKIGLHFYKKYVTMKWKQYHQSYLKTLSSPKGIGFPEKDADF